MRKKLLLRTQQCSSSQCSFLGISSFLGDTLSFQSRQQQLLGPITSSTEPWIYWIRERRLASRSRSGFRPCIRSRRCLLFHVHIPLGTSYALTPLGALYAPIPLGISYAPIPCFITKMGKTKTRCFAYSISLLKTFPHSHCLDSDHHFRVSSKALYLLEPSNQIHIKTSFQLLPDRSCNLQDAQLGYTTPVIIMLFSCINWPVITETAGYNWPQRHIAGQTDTIHHALAFLTAHGGHKLPELTRAGFGRLRNWSDVLDFLYIGLSDIYRHDHPMPACVPGARCPCLSNVHADIHARRPPTVPLSYDSAEPLRLLILTEVACNFVVRAAPDTDMAVHSRSTELR